MKKSSKVLCLFIGLSLVGVLLISAISIYEFTHNKNVQRKFFKLIGINEIVGNGKIESKSVTLTGFDSIEVGGDFNVTVNPGPQSNIMVSSDANILPYININQSNKLVSIAPQLGVAISPSQTERAIVTTPTLHAIKLGGVASLNVLNMNSNNLMLIMSGKNVGNVQGDIKNIQVNSSGYSTLHLKLVNADTIKLNINGIGTVFLAGTTKNLFIFSHGKTIIHANDLIANDVEITGGGVSTVDVHAEKTLTVAISGKSDIKYSGNPAIKRKSFGAVTIQKVS